LLAYAAHSFLMKNLGAFDSFGTANYISKIFNKADILR
jgi:hypothetical protein